MRKRNASPSATNLRNWSREFYQLFDVFCTERGFDDNTANLILEQVVTTRCGQQTLRCGPRAIQREASDLASWFGACNMPVPRQAEIISAWLLTNGVDVLASEVKQQFVAQIFTALRLKWDVMTSLRLKYMLNLSTRQIPLLFRILFKELSDNPIEADRVWGPVTIHGVELPLPPGNKALATEEKKILEAFGFEKSTTKEGAATCSLQLRVHQAVRLEHRSSPFEDGDVVPVQALCDGYQVLKGVSQIAFGCNLPKNSGGQPNAPVHQHCASVFEKKKEDHTNLMTQCEAALNEFDALKSETFEVSPGDTLTLFICHVARLILIAKNVFF